MEHPPLITREDIARYKQLSKSGHDDKLKEQILDAQLLDLQPLIGESLYNKIVENPEAYDSLMAYGTYSHDGVEYINYGLKMVLAYFAYARYVYFGSYVDTPFSIVEKLNDNSRPVESLAKKNLYTLNRDAAMQLWANVKNYLIRTGNTDYKSCGQSAPGRGFRIKKLG
jgi:hypothetical protein